MKDCDITRKPASGFRFRCGLANALLCDFDALGLGELGQAAFDLLVCRDDVAQVAAEQVLIEVLHLAGMVALIPQTAGIRRDLVGEQQRAVGGTAHLDLEID